MNKTNNEKIDLQALEVIKTALITFTASLGDNTFYHRDPQALDDNAMIVYRERFLRV